MARIYASRRHQSQGSLNVSLILFSSACNFDFAALTLSCRDLTDESSVKETHRIISTTLPRIAGVCNGALVLNDELMAKQSHEDFNATLRPKVDGTRYLDALFQQPGELDFFMVFSSLAYSTGNIGQSSYAAANGFMVSLVEGRRKRGLAGSVIHMAGIYGIGYITRRQAGIMDRLEKMGYSNISEWDYLQFFAEGVLAGRPDSRNKIWEISSSVRPGDVDGDNPPPWLDVPRFSFFKRVQRRVAAGNDGDTVSVRAQLKDQTSMDGVRVVLFGKPRSREGFSILPRAIISLTSRPAGLMGILYKLLGMRPEDNIISPSTSLIELGIDSLVAVDMRFWFTRELDLDLPVLKLLGGATVEEMVEDVVDRLSPKLIPNVKIEMAEDASASTPEADTANGKTEPPEDVPDSASDTDSAIGDSSDAERDEKSSSNDNPESMMVSASESGDTEATESQDLEELA